MCTYKLPVLIKTSFVTTTWCAHEAKVLFIFCEVVASIKAFFWSSGLPCGSRVKPSGVNVSLTAIIRSAAKGANERDSVKPLSFIAVTKRFKPGASKVKNFPLTAAAFRNHSGFYR